MKTKTTLILLGLAVAIGLYIKFFESKRPGTAEARQKSLQVVDFDPARINGIIIENGDDRIELRRVEDKWRLESPIKDQADEATVEGLLAEVENWQKESTIAADELEKNKERLEEFGLVKPRLRLKLQGEDAPPEIVFGRDSAFEGRMYVRLANSRDAFIVSQGVKQAITRKPEEFRDKNLTDLATGEVTRLLLATPAGEMELQKTGERWEIVKPMKTAADTQKVNDLIARLTTARVEKFVAEDSADLKPYGLAEPRGSVTLFGSGTPPAPKVLQIGKAAGPEGAEVYVRFVPRAAVYTVPKALETVLQLTPDALRDRQLLRFDPDILDRITLEAPGAKTVLARQEEKWTLASRNNSPADSAEVNRLLQALQGEQVARFVDNVASDLAKYGLDRPSLQLTLSSFASENTAESQAGERPFAKVAFGRTEGDIVFARVADDPFIVAVRRAFVENIPADPLRWQETTIFKFKPEEIRRVSVKTDREIVLTRDDKGAWRSEAVEVNQSTTESLVNTLSNLRAVRWAGATTAAHGFEQPLLTVTFQQGGDGQKEQTLTVGAATPERMWHARIGSREGTFVLSNPDVSALRLPLTVTAPAATPVAPVTPTISPTPAAP